MTRKQIWDKINANNERIDSIRSENEQLAEQDLLLCDEQQWFKETEEDVVVSKRPKRIEKKLIGRIFWKEDFKDEDTKDIITIERQQVVRVNGEWV